MITCPNCKNTLPDWTQVCQFCHTDVSKVVRKIEPQSRVVRGSPNIAPWIWPAYYFISAYFIASGCWHVIDIFRILNHLNIGAEFAKAGPAASMAKDLVMVPIILDILFGVISIILGIGLIFKIEFIRGVTNVLCFLNIAADLLMLVGNGLSAPLVRSSRGGRHRAPRDSFPCD